MADPYFAKFPLMQYQNTLCMDITRRVTIDNKIGSNPFVYLPFTLRSKDWPDSVAEAYYKDQDLQWLVYLSMGVIDPYYAWPLPEDAFRSYIINKYGSLEKAMQRILFWRMDWSDDDQEITTAGYAALPDALRKYYTAIYGQGTQIMAWKRRAQDWKVTTNILVDVEITPLTGTFNPDDKVYLSVGNTVLSNAYISFANSTHAVCHHFFGDLSLVLETDEGEPIETEEGFQLDVDVSGLAAFDSDATAAVSAVHFLANNIAIDERPYWSPVYAWDYEVEENEKRKHIKLIDSKYSGEISRGITKLLKT